MGTGSPFPGVKAQLGHNADHSPPSLVLTSGMSRCYTTLSLSLHGSSGTALLLHKTVVRKPKQRRPFVRPQHKWENITMELEYINVHVKNIHTPVQNMSSFHGYSNAIN
jgi:hypothetical protein